MTSSDMNSAHAGTGISHSVQEERIEPGRDKKRRPDRRSSIFARWLLHREEIETIRARDGEWLGAETLLVSPLEQTKPLRVPRNFDFDALSIPLLRAAERLGYLPVELMTKGQVDAFLSLDSGDSLSAERQFLALVAQAQLDELERLGDDVRLQRNELAIVDESVASRIRADEEAPLEHGEAP